jgi:hypothetical protein
MNRHLFASAIALTPVLLAAIGALALSAPGLAAPGRSVLVNGNFEAPGGDLREQIGAVAVPGWRYRPGQGGDSYEIYESDNHDGLAAADGRHYVSFGHNGTYGGALSQTFATTPGVTYKVTYAVAEQQEDDPRQSMKAVLVNGGETLSRENRALKATFRAGAPIVFTARSRTASLAFVDATPAGGGSIANLALDRVSVTAQPKRR